ncbi:uncharacterized protein [Callorhinus ursinus]|uniref:uncharacterized protein n=1 Tax=Callorhinus ursinus TaxID=34884 RepID=UPI003CD0434A
MELGPQSDRSLQGILGARKRSGNWETGPRATTLAWWRAPSGCGSAGQSRWWTLGAPKTHHPTGLSPTAAAGQTLGLHTVQVETNRTETSSLFCLSVSDSVSEAPGSWSPATRPAQAAAEGGVTTDVSGKAVAAATHRPPTAVEPSKARPAGPLPTPSGLRRFPCGWPSSPLLDDAEVMGSFPPKDRLPPSGPQQVPCLADCKLAKYRTEGQVLPLAGPRVRAAL